MNHFAMACQSVVKLAHFKQFVVEFFRHASGNRSRP